MSRKILVQVDIPWSGIDSIEEYYDVPGDWDEYTRGEQEQVLADMADQELANSGIGYGAEVVDTED